MYKHIFKYRIMHIIILSILFLYIYFYKIINGKIDITNPSQLPVYVKWGGKLELTCEQSDGFRIQWLRATSVLKIFKEEDVWANKFLMRRKRGRQDYIVVGEGHGFEISERVYAGVFEARLTKHNVSEFDAGSYKCATLSGRDKPFAFDVHVLRVLDESGFVRDSINSVEISCELLSDLSGIVDWQKGDAKIMQNGRHFINTSHSYISTKSTLTISYPGEREVGEYNCIFELRSGVLLNHSVFLYSSPHIKFGGTSLNVVEGSDINLECRVWGFPSPIVEWYRVDSLNQSPQPQNHYYHKPITDRENKKHSWPDIDDTGQIFEDINDNNQYNDVLEDKDNRNKILENRKPMDASKHFRNKSLRLLSASLNDRGIYMCVVHSWPIVNGVPIYFTSNATTIIRVRRRFGVVIPLIGLACEAAILLAIIYVYERKRSKHKLLDNHPISIS